MNNKLKKFEETLLEQIEVIARQNKEIEKYKNNRQTPNSARAEIITKVTTDNTFDTSINCKECNFAVKTWNALQKH